jgi:microcystin-dependent protein
MAEPFLSEIRIFSFDYPPKGWAFCNGQLLPINQNQPLFALLGTTYGGDGRVNFALPDLRARLPLHFEFQVRDLGERGGQDAVTLSAPEMPQHTHVARASASNANVAAPGGNVLASASNLYAQPSNLTSLHPSSVTNAGGSQAHENRHPFLALNFCIALQGIFPSFN